MPGHCCWADSAVRDVWVCGRRCVVVDDGRGGQHSCAQVPRSVRRSLSEAAADVAVAAASRGRYCSLWAWPCVWASRQLRQRTATRLRWQPQLHCHDACPDSVPFAEQLPPDGAANAHADDADSNADAGADDDGATAAAAGDCSVWHACCAPCTCTRN